MICAQRCSTHCGEQSQVEERRMNLTMVCRGAHPAAGEEVVVMDEVDVTVCTVSINSISSQEERMGE
jgi:hypothetical protein